MKTIKEIAGGVLLYIYVESRKSPLDIDFKNYYFRYEDGEWDGPQKLDDFQESILKAADGDEANLLNAVRYLVSAGFIKENTDGSDSGGLMYRDMRLTATGFDLIEGVERETDNTKSQFNVTFNFNLESIAKITPTLQAKFGLFNI